jgi:hypothetical protein
MIDLPEGIQDLLNRIEYGVTWCGAPSIIRFESDKPAAALAVSCDIALMIPIIVVIAIASIAFVFNGVVAKLLLDWVNVYGTVARYQGNPKPPGESIGGADGVPWRLDSADFTKAERRPPNDE